ncbi:QWRF motif-containing protein 3-like [Dendrobium catenatum]|uniref:QWRF motif-containing protein 3-like n=1 Tax=Dendrobium catenatum TaxID=906689 RepID=UPI00109F6208|nr:QWRF motif-containing protein 3-like [Dendrobium catenatum]
MERRRSLPRANIAANAAAAAKSPLSDHNKFHVRRKSISFAPFNNTSDDDSLSSPVHSSSFLRLSNSALHRTSNNAAAAAKSPLSDHNKFHVRRKSISFAPFNNTSDDDSLSSPVHSSSFLRPSNSALHRTSNNTSSSTSLANRKSTTESPRRLHKQNSSEDLQSRVLWPSSKKPNPSADAEDEGVSEPLERHLDHDHRIDASATYNVSTFSSRQRSDQSAVASEDKKVDRGRRSLRYHIGKFHVEHSLKKPRTPPSPSSSSSSNGQPPAPSRTHSGRFSINKAALARKKSDFGVDFPSTESEQSENVGPAPRVSRVRRPVSPLKGKNGGVGNFISQGLNNLFRRKSFQGSSAESVKKPIAAAGFGSPVRERPTTVKGMGSPGREGMVTAKVYGSSPSRGTTVAAVDGEMQYKLRILHNYLIQWRFVNAGTAVVNKIMCDNAESTLVNALVGLSDLRTSVAKKRAQLEKEKLKFKLNMLVCHQTKALETWGTMERHHLAALSSTKDSLQAAVCRLPITDHAKVDPHLLSISLRQATNMATAINGNIAKCHSRVRIQK